MNDGVNRISCFKLQLPDDGHSLMTCK